MDAVALGTYSTYSTYNTYSTYIAFYLIYYISFHNLYFLLLHCFIQFKLTFFSIILNYFRQHTGRLVSRKGRTCVKIQRRRLPGNGCHDSSLKDRTQNSEQYYNVGNHNFFMYYKYFVYQIEICHQILGFLGFQISVI